MTAQVHEPPAEVTEKEPLKMRNGLQLRYVLPTPVRELERLSNRYGEWPLEVVL